MSLAPTESVKKKGRTLARSQSDMVLEITAHDAPQRDAFLLEFQIDDDGTMLLRVFEYALSYAQRRKAVSEDGSVITLPLPEACVVYWEHTPKTPDTVTLRLAGAAGHYDYEAKVLKVLEQSVEDLKGHKLGLVLPFYLLKYRKQAKRAEGASEKLRELAGETGEVFDELVNVTEWFKKQGQLSEDDSILMLDHIVRMYNELYGRYEEFTEEQMRVAKRIETPMWDRFQALKREAREAKLEAIEAKLKTEELAKQAEQKTRNHILDLLRQGYTTEQLADLLNRESDER